MLAALFKISRIKRLIALSSQALKFGSRITRSKSHQCCGSFVDDFKAWLDNAMNLLILDIINKSASTGGFWSAMHKLNFNDRLDIADQQMTRDGVIQACNIDSFWSTMREPNFEAFIIFYHF